jgi:hypothetical protein
MQREYLLEGLAEDVADTALKPLPPGETGQPHMSVAALVCGRFCIAQIVVNCALSFCFPLGFFWLLWSPHSPLVTHEVTYRWNDPHVLSPIIMSPWLCGLISGAFLPIGLPDAWQNGWFAPMHARTAARVRARLPCLGARHGAVRHFTLACLVALVWVPAALVAVRFGLGGELRAQTFVLFVPAYIGTLPLALVPLALLGFAVPHAFLRVRSFMPTDGPIVRRMLRRVLNAPLC